MLAISPPVYAKFFLGRKVLSKCDDTLVGDCQFIHYVAGGLLVRTVLSLSPRFTNKARPVKTISLVGARRSFSGFSGWQLPAQTDLNCFRWQPGGQSIRIAQIQNGNEPDSHPGSPCMPGRRMLNQGVTLTWSFYWTASAAQRNPMVEEPKVGVLNPRT
jgi:hypothetical protein